MGFWITISIVLFLLVVISTFGPMLGLYGEMEYKREEKRK